MKKYISLFVLALLYMNLCGCGRESPEGDLRPEFKEAMDSYEIFYEEYFAALQRYTADPSDPEAADKYLSMVDKLTKMDIIFAAWENADLTEKEMKYYQNVNTRIQEKLFDLM